MHIGSIHDENRRYILRALKFPTMNRRPIVSGFLFFAILVLGSVSGASLVHEPRRLARHKPKLEPLKQKISPSPSPAPAKSDSLTPNVSPVPAADPSGSAAVERCSTTSLQCRDLGAMTACLQRSLPAPEEFHLLVQNDGDNPLKVNITISHATVDHQEMQVPKHEIKKIIISINAGDSPLIVLNAGNGECRLRSSTSEGNFFQQLPRANLLNPIHGAYLVFAVALIIGATFACCKLRSGRQGDGIAYQELEMGRPETLSANSVETADWDEGWDDDEWDKMKEVKNLSEDGFTLRPSDSNGWDSDWDK